MQYVPSKVVSLKKSAEHTEKWVQEIIANDPQILGLGDITLRETERRQLNGGRLDLLFDDETAKIRYTVELQLGATDETHIIRTIEYWDNERSRNPHVDHIAVIVAEDITTTTPTDRTYWLKKGTPETVKMADRILELVHEVVGEDRLELNYNKYYIGLASGGVANNFVSMKPQKQQMVLRVRLPRTDEITELIEQNLELVSYSPNWGLYQVRITQNDLTQSVDVIKELIRRAAGIAEADEA